jgi:hypothetical protein
MRVAAICAHYFLGLQSAFVPIAVEIRWIVRVLKRFAAALKA